MPHRRESLDPTRLCVTVLKFQGMKLQHVLLYCDCLGVPGAAYTRMTRVQRGRQCLIGTKVTVDPFTLAE